MTTAIKAFAGSALMFLCCGAAAVAQSVQQPLTASALRSTVEALAHDSTGGRGTPSVGLEKAAKFIAARFSEIGLKPIGDDGTFFQRFPVATTLLDPDTTFVKIGDRTVWRYGADFHHVGGTGDATGTITGEAVIVTGSVNPESARSAGIDGKVVIFAGALNANGRLADFRQAFALASAGARAIIVPSLKPDTVWMRLRADIDEFKPASGAAWDVWTAHRPVAEGFVRFLPILELWEGRLPGLLAATGIDSSSLYAADGRLKVTPVAPMSTMQFNRRVDSVAWAANVVGVIEGSDPLLKHEYIVYSAHLDGLGLARGSGAILNGADDNASGVAAILSVAKSLTGREARPLRSVIFLAVAGEERGLWGSDYFAARPPVLRSQIIANINLDMVGRAKADSVYILGRSDSRIGSIADSVLKRTARGLTVLDEKAVEARFPGQRAGERSDMVNFIRRGIPAVHFFTGWHDDYHEATDDAATLNYEALAKIARAAFDIGVELSRYRFDASRAARGIR